VRSVERGDHLCRPLAPIRFLEPTAAAPLGLVLFVVVA
jgi:hypothetical protein